MLSLIKIKDIHQCEDTDHVYAIVAIGNPERYAYKSSHRGSKQQ